MFLKRDNSGKHDSHLFVGEGEEDGVSQFVFGEHAHQLFASLADSLTIVAVDDEDQTWASKATLVERRP